MSQVIKDWFGFIAVAVGLIIAPFAALITHVVSCIQHEQWLLLIAGTLAFPVGIIHGTGLWFGLF